MDIVNRCHAVLEQALRESGLTGHLAVLRDGESMYIDQVQSDGFVQVSTYVGLRWPAHTSEVGKVLLAFLPGPRREKTLAGMKLKRLTPRTITSRSVLARQLASFLRTGYGWERNEGGWGWAVWPHPCSGLGTSCWRASA
jgi:DNA-binding IclR family transcriptional regulator